MISEPCIQIVRKTTLYMALKAYAAAFWVVSHFLSMLSLRAAAKELSVNCSIISPAVLWVMAGEFYESEYSAGI